MVVAYNSGGRLSFMNITQGENMICAYNTIADYGLNT